jgi:hypothetical protein
MIAELRPFERAYLQRIAQEAERIESLGDEGTDTLDRIAQAINDPLTLRAIIRADMRERGLL